MSRKPNTEPLDGLPPELAALDRELSSLELDERPSFGPELRNELARSWPFLRRRRGIRFRRYAAAAAVAGVALAGVLVPPARAALSDGVQRIMEVARPDGGVLDEMEVVVVPLPERPSSEARPGVVALRTEEEEEGPATAEAPAVEETAGTRMPAFQPGTSTPPRVLDPETARATVQRFYPEALQAARIGGTASVLLWVREDGSVSSVEVARGTGLGVLDRAARGAASALRFEPARRNGVPIGTWVEFDIVFDPTPSTRAVVGDLPALSPEELLPGWSDAGTVPPPVQLEAREMLRVAMGADRATLESVYGPLDGILRGTPPAGADPDSWRAAVTLALDDARVRDPENPAPYLALARIRRSQGRRSAAWNLFQEGYRRAVRGVRPVSPGLTAELSFESGRLARENWLAWRGLRDFAPRDTPGARCSAVPAAPATEVSAEVVLAWNFNCTDALRAALVAGAGATTREEDLRREMARYFRAAVEARPGHVGANTELLLLLAEAGEWEALLDGAARFAQGSGGHPSALLLEGLARARTGDPAGASTRFQSALERLPADVREAFAGGALARRTGAGWADDPEDPSGGPASAESLWLHLDPVLSTPVNERLVEHWARASYAWLRFGSLETDAARAWLRFGEPRAVRSVATDSGLRLELWSYGDSPALAFMRPSYAEGGTLAPEARAYLQGLDEAGAELRYGRALPAPDELDAELVETAAAMGNGTDLQIRLSLKEEPAPGPPLQVGVYLLGFDGTPVRVERWQVERDAGGVELTVPMDPQVREAVVELMDPATGRVSAARTPISLTAAGQR